MNKAKKKIEKLNVIDSEIKQTAMSYFKAAREAEDSVVKFQKIKFEVSNDS